MNDREAFETFITAPPFKRRSLGRFDALGAWPGNYINNEINFAWKVWQAATEAEREWCAKVCDAIAEDKLALYKGRAPYTGKEPGRASDHTQGQSDGADQCADAIRKGQ